MKQLAVSHKLRTEGYTSSEENTGDKTGGTRTITITRANGKEITVSLADDETSLDQIAKAINKQDGGVRASVQRSDDGYQLVLSSRTAGTEGQMSVQVTGDDALGDILNTSEGGQRPDPNDENKTIAENDRMFSVAEAQDAQLIVDGISYTRSSNSITDIIAGVTLNLTGVSEEGKAEQLTLNVDTSAIKTTLQEFVKQYNALLSQTSSASKFVPSDTSGLADDDVAKPSSENGALMGDGTLRGPVGELRSVVNGVYGDKDVNVSALSSLGISIDAATGQMTLDTEKLDKAIADYPEQIGALFKGNGEKEGRRPG